MAVTALLFIGANFTAHAQAQALTATKLVAEPVTEEIAQPDSVVRIVADAKELPRVSPDQLPVHGTFWVVIGGGSFVMPMPFISYDQANSPVYSLGSPGQFLVDATRGVAPQPTWKQAARGVTSAALLERQGNAILDLVEQVHTADLKAQQTAELATMEAASGKMTTDGGMRRMSLSGMGGSQLNSQEAAIDYGTNLWLEIPAVTNGAAYVVLHNVTQGEVYELMTKPALTDPAWLPELALHPVMGQDWIDATVPMLDRTSALFFWARDWTGIDENTNSLPDWWEWENFGNLNQTTNGDYDGDGASNLVEFQDSTDPNTITFSVRMTNNYVRTSSPTIPLNVSAGVPFSKAVLVDSTNFAGADWTAFNSSNLTSDLSANEGWHQVWIGLRGRLETSQQTWCRTRIKLDVTPPQLIVTSPSSTNVLLPVIQLQGYCPEALTAISYDLANDAGLITNQPVLVLDQVYDTNAWEFTTNYFQCFDVSLTNGANTLTLHATDLAGNVTVTNFTFLLDYASLTNPPTISLDWPQDGTRIGSDNFTWRGWLNDPTAQVMAQIVDPNGVTNNMAGRIGRNGDFRVENLPVTGGTNALTLRVTDAFGNFSSTNITVAKSDVILTVETAAFGQGASGLISDTNYTVWVNEVQAINNGNGTWSASQPHLTLDTPVVHVQATPPASGNGYSANASSSSSAQDAETEVSLPRPDGIIYQKEMHKEFAETQTYTDPYSYQIVTNTLTRIYNYHWQAESGGTGEVIFEHDPIWQMDYHSQLAWASDNWPFFGDINGTPPPGHPDNGGACYGSTDLAGSHGYIHSHYADQSQLTLVTGDNPDSTSGELYQITGSAQERYYTSQYFPSYMSEEAITHIADIPPEQIQVGALGRLDTNGTLWAALPAHTNVNVTPHVSGNGWRQIGLQGQPYKLVSQCVATTPANRARTTIGVGEQVTVNFSPNLPANVNATWSTTGGGISTNLAKQITFTAPNNAANVTITATVKGQACRMNFNVREPTGIVRAQITGTNSYSLNVAGAGMTNVLWIGPTNVSFYRVNVMEVGEDASNIYGFFADTNYFTVNPAQRLHHNPASWTRLTSDNRFSDHAAFGGYLPWAAGGFEWNIPQRWQVDGSGVTNSMAGCNQVFLIDASGTARVDKYGNWIQRTTNNVVTTN